MKKALSAMLCAVLFLCLPALAEEAGVLPSGSEPAVQETAVESDLAEEETAETNPFDEDDSFTDPEAFFTKIESEHIENGWAYSISWDILLDDCDDAIPVRYTVYLDGTVLKTGRYTQSGRKHTVIVDCSDSHPDVDTVQHVIQLYVEADAPDGLTYSNIHTVAGSSMVCISETSETFLYSHSQP